jgi:transcriptional regulator with XRE-family HTH domain
MDKGFKIRMLREKKGISQKEVALKLGINQSTYCKMEGCEERISIENCEKIAKAIGVTISDILDFEGKYNFIEKQNLELITKLNNECELLLAEIAALKKDNRILIRLLGKNKKQIT